MKLSISMTRRETLLGWSYLLISMFALPFFLVFCNDLLPRPLSEAVINLLFFAVNFLCTAVIFRRFLRKSIILAANTPWRCLRFAGLGFLLYQVANILLSKGILWIDPAFSNVNDAAIGALTQEYSALIAIATVFLVPVYEELLYRGLLFQGLHSKNRFLAYALSMAVFSSIHVMGYVGLYDFGTLALCFVQYLPAGAALCWAYEQSDTIAAPILMHITINQIGIAALR